MRARRLATLLRRWTARRCRRKRRSYHRRRGFPPAVPVGIVSSVATSVNDGVPIAVGRTSPDRGDALGHRLEGVGVGERVTGTPGARIVYVSIGGPLTLKTGEPWPLKELAWRIGYNPDSAVPPGKFTFSVSLLPSPGNAMLPAITSSLVPLLPRLKLRTDPVLRFKAPLIVSVLKPLLVVCARGCRH